MCQVSNERDRKVANKLRLKHNNKTRHNMETTPARKKGAQNTKRKHTHKRIDRQHTDTDPLEKTRRLARLAHAFVRLYRNAA